MKPKIILFSIVVIVLLVAVIVIINLPKENNNNNLGDKYVYGGRTGNFTLQRADYGDFNDTLIYVYVTINNIDYLKTIPLEYGPYQLEDYDIEVGIEKKIFGTKYVKKDLFITQDLDTINNTKSSSLVAATEIAKVTGTADYSIFNMNTRAAFTANDGTLGPESIVTCDNANPKIAVIYLKLGEKNKVYSQDECVIIEATDAANFRKGADALIYKLIGVF